MKRSKRHRVKQELPETSTSRPVNQKEHDLAYYIHDRVELMHQVFSVLKPKELKAMAPECVRHISISDLQELCMEELLGISSKRLCAILDGASAPSDTESSSESEQLETISLDSISSDEEILSQVSSKKSKKHKHRSKSKPKKRKSKDKEDEDKDQADRSRRAGLTVLELLELQARARAIRAQLQQEQASAVSTGRPSESVTGNSSDDEVEIKEETAEVVEISSEDEKPDIQELEERIAATCKDVAPETSSNSETVTKKVNDLIITVPKPNTSRKIKLKRNTTSNLKTVENVLESGVNSVKKSVVDETKTTHGRRHGPEINKHIDSNKSDVNAIATQASNSKDESSKVDVMIIKDKCKNKDKKKKRKKDKHNDKYGSDHDEITLQLSDTEKMDLLEDLEGKKSDKCHETEDSSSDSSDGGTIEEDDSDRDTIRITTDGNTHKTNSDKDVVDLEKSSERTPVQKNISNDVQINRVDSVESNKLTELDHTDVVNKEIVEQHEALSNDLRLDTCDVDKSNTSILKGEKKSQQNGSEEKEADIIKENALEISFSHDTALKTSDVDITFTVKESVQDLAITLEQKFNNNETQSIVIGQATNNENVTEVIKEINVIDNVLETATCDKVLLSNSDSTAIENVSNNEAKIVNTEDLKQKSDGELSDRDSSEVEASDFKPDVVCISDDEEKKKKKKKDKKSKRVKKSKKKKDFRESADENFYSQTNKSALDEPDITKKEVTLISEAIEICDGSSKCDSVMMVKVKDSQEKEVITIPETETRELKNLKLEDRENFKSKSINTDVDFDDDVYEVLELSDDSSCYELEEISISKEPTAEEIEALSAKLDKLERDRAINNEIQVGKDSEDLSNVSWKDRYLESSKVKKVLTTANIMNAMRKKNLELKKKLQESKKKTEVVENSTENIEIATSNFEDGSIEQYNTLEASTTYVDPVKEVIENSDNGTEIENGSEAKRDNTTKSNKDTVTKEMKKEAKQLLKMYKMLLKYNDMSKQKDPSKKRKKKKKSKDKDKSVASQVVTSS